MLFAAHAQLVNDGAVKTPQVLPRAVEEGFGQCFPFIEENGQQLQQIHFRFGAWFVRFVGVDNDIEGMAFNAHFNRFACPKRVAVEVSHPFALTSDAEFGSLESFHVTVDGQSPVEQLECHLW